MNIAIIGTGNMATSLTKVLGKANRVTIYGRDGDEAKSLADEHSADAQKLGESIEEEVVILALPYTAISDFLKEHSQMLEGKTLVDISNAMDWQKMELLEGEGALTIAKSLPSNSKLIKAFNTVPAPILAEGKIGDTPIDIFLAGDDQESKDKLAQAINECGMRAVDVGPISRAPYLESMLLINSVAGYKVNDSKPVSIKILPA
jgi:predicted dinucleotide-binding enzyme